MRMTLNLVMGLWKEFLDSLHTPGGHMIVLLGLMLMGVWMAAKGVPKGEEIVVGAFSALLMMARGSEPNGKKP